MIISQFTLRNIIPILLHNLQVLETAEPCGAHFYFSNSASLKSSFYTQFVTDPSPGNPIHFLFSNTYFSRLLLPFLL